MPRTTEKTERNEQVLIERASGDTLHEIGRRHGVSHVAVHGIVVRQTRRHIDKIELDLMVAAKLDQAYGLAVPNQLQADRAVALSYVTWVIRQLRERGVEVEVETKGAPDGMIVLLTDVRTHRLAREADSRRESR